jgi:hypothetical protein
MAGGAAELPKWQAISKWYLYQPILSANHNDSQPAKTTDRGRKLPKWQA